MNEDKVETKNRTQRSLLADYLVEFRAEKSIRGPLASQ